MTRNEHIRALQEEYAHQRAENEAAQAARVDEVCQRVPEIAALREESRRVAFGAMRSILKQQTAEERRAVAEDMKRRGKAINARIRALLRDAGYPENALELQYRCPVCRDTGLVGEAPARFCECFELRLKLRQHEDGSMAGVEEQNFEHFNPNFAPEEGGQRRQLMNARLFCEDYADTFPDTRYRNLLLTGASGLGKTFLLNCVFERVVSRGKPAIRVTAFRMFEQMRRQHFGEDTEREFDALLEAPLLLIDDLGTEPIMRNVTVEYLFTLLNERMAAKRHTVIATNLTIPQLKERYGERVVSRLLDRGCGAALQLTGKDLRTL